MAELVQLQDLAIEILEHTHDGNDLSPFDLQLIEDAVNGLLSDAGQKVFLNFHRRVMEGQYP